MNNDAPKPSWRNTLDTEGHAYGHFEAAKWNAHRIGYPYFNWKGRLYLSFSGRDTGLKVDVLGDLPPFEPERLPATATREGDRR